MMRASVMTQTTQPQPAAPSAGDAFLRRGRELLAQGRLAPAAAAGWQAAVHALNAYAATPDDDGNGFQAAALRLSQDPRGDGRAAEWAVSALALSDNIRYDWLDRHGVGRRLDDVQRLAMLVKDIASPPQSAADVLRQARQCLHNGYPIPAADKGWEAALLAAKTYADAAGCEYRGENHFDMAVSLLVNEPTGGSKVVDWKFSALRLRETVSHCAWYPHRLNAEMVADDIADVANLVMLAQQTMAAKRQIGVGNV